VKKEIEDLIDEMTLQEKVSLCTGADWWHTTSIERLGIPSIRMADGPHGTRIPSAHNEAASLPATCFPTGVSMAATWNTELINRVGAALAEETKAKGCHILLGPTVNIHRSPLAGRNFESFSEDPYLSARMAVAHIKGVQSGNVGTSIKHFALNNSEFERFTISSEVGERAFREIYLPAFQSAVVEAQPWTVMSSYNKINGTWASENRYLLTDILKNEWGFEGFVVTDWFATGSTVGSAQAGLDLEMPGPPRFYGDLLEAAVENGEVSQGVIDDKVRRILGVIAKSGGFEGKNTSSTRSSNTPEHQKLAREAADEAIVLLKNENNILPIEKESIRSIAVIGPNADVARIHGGGSSKVEPYYAVTPLEGLKKICGESITVSFEKGCRNNIVTPLFDFNHFRPPGGEGNPGLLAEYFNNNNLSGDPVATKLDTVSVFRWTNIPGGTTPGPNINPEDFSIRWTGTFLAPTSGEYRFGLRTDGFCRIIIDDKVVVEKWGIEGAETEDALQGERVGEINLKAGEGYDMRVEYCHDVSGESPMRRLRLGCELPLDDNSKEHAAAIAAESDIALIFAGLTEEYDTEHFDREDMDLPGAQEDLIELVSRANKNTVVVLTNGSPVSMSRWVDRVPGIIEALYPGQECGNAIAGILFGEVNPSGKLPETFPMHLEDNPAFINYPGENGKVLYGEGIFVGYRYYDVKRIEPVFPFGHGLSYTNFEYSNLTISPQQLKMDDSLRVSVDIKNTGEREGKEVIQLYLCDVESSLVRPPKELKGFKKVRLLPGETKTIPFDLGKEHLSFYDPSQGDWVAEPGEFEVLIGSSSRDIRAKGSFYLLGQEASHDQTDI
jgi:beta-glucosidase